MPRSPSFLRLLASSLPLECSTVRGLISVSHVPSRKVQSKRRRYSQRVRFGSSTHFAHAYWTIGSSVYHVRVCVCSCFGVETLSSDAAKESNLTVDRGEYTCKARNNGGFLFASAATRVKITGALVANNVATRRGGAVSGFRLEACSTSAPPRIGVVSYGGRSEVFGLFSYMSAVEGFGCSFGAR